MALLQKSTLNVSKPTVAARRQVAPTRVPRNVRMSARAPEQSKYFDLQDLENTTGAWDMYGVDEKKRYPGLQEEFFNRATDAVSRRESLNGFAALSGLGALAIWGLKGTEITQLPIMQGPRPDKTENGKGGILRSRV